MRVLVLYAHPVETSFAASLHHRVVEGLTHAGHDIDDCDLYAEGFDPLLSRQERLGYHDIPDNRRTVASHVDRLLAAEALVIVAPVWNFGHPAILKGYFDRVFLPGVSFKMRGGEVVPALTHIRKLSVVTTYGGSRFRVLLVGDPPRKLAGRVLRALIRPGAAFRYHALYNMNRADAPSRHRFLDRVGRAMETF
ncbi:NAD(P)H dehydrogenase (quinone) [Roseibium aquae]|uniref:NAD(P)H dehydrogenase (Quinone) n=1 Tax=Roseibium aquae TaxID=1323746 RepID=A0A916X3U5_9HYPH|nr:NAD(P)H-dependent oxidoreductase [Roseibium aquae]GGB61724.1 NAD(P)H dehydrogenase (quinone) [Roseibium aquae]